MSAISGATRLAAVIGDPARHSLSPALHNAAFAATGLDWVYLAFDVARGRAVDALAAMRVLGVEGYSVTMPHKAAAAAACDQLSDSARALESVNTVVNRDGVLFGDSTDGAGLLAALADEGVDAARAGVLVLGAGGAARAIVDALGRVGARVTIAGRATSAHAKRHQLSNPASGPARHGDACRSSLRTPPCRRGGDRPRHLSATRAWHG